MAWLSLKILLLRSPGNGLFDSNDNDDGENNDDEYITIIFSSFRTGTVSFCDEIVRTKTN